MKFLLRPGSTKSQALNIVGIITEHSNKQNYTPRVALKIVFSERTAVTITIYLFSKINLRRNIQLSNNRRHFYSQNKTSLQLHTEKK